MTRTSSPLDLRAQTAGRACALAVRVSAMRFACTIVVIAISIASAHAQSAPGDEPVASEPVREVIRAACAQVSVTKYYDPSYVRLAYPGGDVPIERGVCTDVVIRAFRAAGVDLQRSVHEDMRRAFDSYPKRWGLSRPDSNIDHRRVPNLATLFTRQGHSVAASPDAETYIPGDVVTWDLGGGVPHIGIVTARRDPDSNRRLIVHNIGNGAQLEDVLFHWKITGHFRCFR